MDLDVPAESTSLQVDSAILEQKLIPQMGDGDGL